MPALHAVLDMVRYSLRHQAVHPVDWLFDSRLPVRGLAISCGVCGHGGHWACYRRLRAERPACDKTYPAHDRSAAALRSPSRSRANSDLVGPGIPNLERLTTIEQKKEQDNGSKLSDTDTTTLKGHPCAAGCGHWCMLRAQKGT
jgi:hypothetical protein